MSTDKEKNNITDPDRDKSPEQSRGVNPDASGVDNWDKSDYMSRNIEKNRPEFERSNLNPDREKRTGSNLNPDRNSGDR